MKDVLTEVGCAVLLITAFLAVSCGFKETAELYKLIFLRLRRVSLGRALLVLGAGLAVFYVVVSARGRYTVMRVADGAAYQVDNLTGRSWLLVGDRKMPVQQQKPTEKH